MTGSPYRCTFHKAVCPGGCSDRGFCWAEGPPPSECEVTRRGESLHFNPPSGRAFWGCVGELDLTPCITCDGEGHWDSCFDCGNRGYTFGPVTMKKILERRERQALLDGVRCSSNDGRHPTDPS